MGNSSSFHRGLTGINTEHAQTFAKKLVAEWDDFVSAVLKAKETQESPLAASPRVSSPPPASSSSSSLLATVREEESAAAVALVRYAKAIARDQSGDGAMKDISEQLCVAHLFLINQFSMDYVDRLKLLKMYLQDNFIVR